MAPDRPRPSRLAAWMEQAGRDARMLLDGLRGRHPAPLLPRRARAHDLQPRATDTPASPRLRSSVPGHAAEIVRVQMDDQTHDVQVPPGETILEAALAAGLPMPFSCTVGGCGACMVERRAGVVVMDEPNCLTPAEREAGLVLICVGRPVGPVSIAVAPSTRPPSRTAAAGE